MTGMDTDSAIRRVNSRSNPFPVPSRSMDVTSSSPAPISAARAAEMGAGELLVTSIDREGTGKGFDLELTRRIAESVSIPVIACGGAGIVEHVVEIANEG